MKVCKISLVAVSGLVVLSTTQAQAAGQTSGSSFTSGWVWQNPLPQGHHLESVAFLDPDTLVAVGQYGTVLKSTDAGLNWTIQNPAIHSLFAVTFSDALTGTAVGVNGTIVRTADGGVTWERQQSNTMSNL